MIVEVQSGVRGFADSEAHPMPLPFLVILADVGDEGRAVLELGEALVEV